MHNRLQTLIGVALLAAAAGSLAAPNDKRGDVLVAQAGGEARCRKDVKDYVEAMRFVRQSAGAQVGDKVAGNYVSEEQLEKVASAQGSCAAAQILRDKGAIR